MDRQEARAGEEETRVLDHVRLTVAVLLGLLLLLLWWRGYGPGSSAACCAGEAGTALSTPVTTPAGEPLPPAVTIVPSAPQAPPAATGDEAASAEMSPPAVEARAPAAVAPPAAVEVESHASEPAPVTAETEPPAAGPPYTLTDPNAQVRTEPVRLPAWEGPQPPVYHHDVYVPPPVVSAPLAAAPEIATAPTTQEPGAVMATPEPAPAEVAAAQESVPAAPTEESAAQESVPAAPTEESAVQESTPAAPAQKAGESAAVSPAYVIEDPNAQVRTAAPTLPEWTGPHYAAPHHDVYYPPAAQPVAAAVPPAAKLYFDTAKWELPADAGEVLAPIVSYLDGHPEARAVIQGFHDPRGSRELNAALARNRAGATWAALVAAGIARERIVLRQPADSTGSGTLVEARRAEVSILGQ
ncbi:MAG: hypothetical protein NFCOHLIN_01504 [Gammaproteobacteria bacterium]|nr:hypothetical protein [Gammaproteobacteria bacterium]